MDCRCTLFFKITFFMNIVTLINPHNIEESEEEEESTQIFVPLHLSRTKIEKNDYIVTCAETQNGSLRRSALILFLQKLSNILHTVMSQFSHLPPTLIFQTTRRSPCNFYFLPRTAVNVHETSPTTPRNKHTF